MEKNYLIINIGSTSKRYALFNNTTALLTLHFTQEDAQYTVTSTNTHNQRTLTSISQQEYNHSIAYVLKYLKTAGYTAITACGIRIVAPTSYFSKTQLITKEYVTRLGAIQNILPLHIQPLYQEIIMVSGILPHVSMVAVSDSTFHTTIPDQARTYGLPIDITQELELYRFGYHGISLQSVVRTLGNTLGFVPARMIICHLGGGASITAVHDGKSIDTSMGFTPLEGVPMATRSGSLDPSIPLYIAQKYSLSLDQLNSYLNTQCGLLGLSGITSDIKTLVALAKTGVTSAQRALDIYIYAIKKYIGAYAAALGSLDMLIFTGTVGERSAILRSRICNQLTLLGITIDEEKNTMLEHTTDGYIHHHESSTHIGVIISREMQEIALCTKNFLGH